MKCWQVKYNEKWDLKILETYNEPLLNARENCKCHI